MTKTLPTVLTWSDRPRVRLRLADWPDAESMRVWKNANKQFFFHKEDISPEQQRAWFAQYLLRKDDHNYIAEEQNGDAFEAVGVLACRTLDGALDVYNVMRGHRTAAQLLNMGEALGLLCEEARRSYGLPITCKVLADNPAMAWYERNGFTPVGKGDDYVLLRYIGRDRT
jgi:ribosomal protein S18 acetylase RimI-like enzyme